MNVYRFFYSRKYAQIIDSYVIFFLIVFAIFGFFNRYFIRVTRYRLTSNKNIKLKFAFISDLHIGDTGINHTILNKAVDKINKENVDFVILGGDIIEQDARYFTSTKLNEDIKNIKSKYGVFGVLGNHEYYGGMPYEISSTLEKNGNIKMLNDSYIQLDKNIVIIGREDPSKHYFNYPRLSIDKILKINNKDYNIVIDHNPADFQASIDNNIDLQISGHTHNGQFFPFNIIVKFFHKKSYGILKEKKSTLIVSSGISTWRIPIKLFSKPEIVIVEIN